MNIREKIEEREVLYLSKYAMLAINTKGRENFEEKCPLRTDFQRDRDRILHSKAFRRLKHKTQVFISPSSDHYRTRLTHTLELSQIARTLARALDLNEDLVEAISLGHDLGHTPFGHIGEEALNESSSLGFKHNIQSLRIVESIEKTEKRVGLNLTYEVRDGIRNHTGGQMPKTLEGDIVRISDRIAYINHDIDDSVRAGIISEKEIPKDLKEILGYSHGERINSVTQDIVSNSLGKNEIKQSDEYKEAMLELRRFMFQKVYLDDRVKSEADKAKGIIKKLFAYYMENADKVFGHQTKGLSQAELDRYVCDYIAGMTDRYVMYKYEEAFIPKSWSVM